MPRRGQRTALAAAAASTLALSVTAPLAAAPGAQGTGDIASRDDAPVLGGETARNRKGYYDARQVGAPGEVVAATKVLDGPSPAKVNALQDDLGPSAVIDIDPLTGTPSNLTRLNGFLTAPSSRSADSVVRSYIDSHASDLGLTQADLSTFDLRKDYVDVVGTHHLSYTQSANGVSVFGNGLKAHVTKNGQLISVQGSPIAGLAGLTADAGTTPQLSASAARERAARDVGGAVQDSSTQRSTADDTQWANGDNARLVWFVSASGPRLAWATYTQAGDTLDYSHVIDARSGDVLYRRDLVDHAEGDARVYDYYPGAARGGDAKVVNFLQQGWLGRRASWLTGESVTAWADLNDDDAVSNREKTPVPGTDRRAQFTLQPFNDASRFCGRSYVCTWDHNEAFSWRVNENADVTNAFYLASNFHDYLARPPIGFNARAGNFERADNDQVLLHALDGANTATDENGDPIGLPDGNHVDNANMSTPPDGTAPTMQMYLFRFPGSTIQQDPFLPVSSSFDATVLYHEYVHGLSNRLVVDADGNSTLNSIQANAMGEAWSDWYAMDYLVKRGFQRDSEARDGQIGVGKYTLAGREPFRTMPMDCDPDSSTARCTQIDGQTRAGYTYGDFPTIGGAPQVHASGEVWAQTLWDIREAMGHRVADMLVTRGMELSSNDPSMLDMRNAILQADKVAYGSRNTRQLWRIFANRGMGWYAGTIDAGDVNPAEDFHTPPSASRGYGTVAGYVLNRLTGRPINGARVTITGHPEYSDRTGADGIYQIDNVLPGRYQKVAVKADGFEVVVKRVRVQRGFTQKDFSARRDWAARSGGASIADFNGPDYSNFGCGPEGAIDLSQGTGWGSTTGDDDGNPADTVVPKYIVVELPRAIDLAPGDGGRSAFAVDPTATCGDAGSASTGDFTIEVAQSEAGPWTEVASRQGEDSWLPRFQFSNVAAEQDLAGVRYVRFTMESPQVPDFATNCPDGPYDGCVFMDLTELEVFGVRTGAAPAPAAPRLEPLR